MRCWFKSTAYGDEKDRVIVRENGIKTYFASDIAFVFNKLERGFEHLFTSGARITTATSPACARASSPSAARPIASRFAWCSSSRCSAAAQKAQMSTRSGEFVTLRALREEVGNDAARLFYVMRSNDQHLDFDLELAKARSNDNPVYYIQYAHARVVERAAPDGGARHRARSGAGPRRARLGHRAAGAEADQAHLRVSRRPSSTPP